MTECQSLDVNFQGVEDHLGTRCFKSLLGDTEELFTLGLLLLGQGNIVLGLL